MAKVKPKTWDIRDLKGARVGLYCRASKDPMGQAKSVTDQTEVGAREVAALGATVAGQYDRDNDRSASRFATKAREDFERLVTDITAGKLDGVWFWDLSRQQRQLRVFAELRDLCRERGLFWMIRGRLYDLSDPNDIRALGYDAVTNEAFSEQLSANVRRGKASSAIKGRPAGKLTYGYRRIYDENRRGAFIEQVPDDVPREAFAQDGRTVTYTRAGIVREIITAVAAGTSFHAIKRGLYERGIPSPTGLSVWAVPTLRVIALNPAYIGRRVYQGEVLDLEERCWKSLVSDEVFYAARNRLHDPARRRTKPSRAKWLASHIIRCDTCGSPMDRRSNQRRSGRKIPPTYGCKEFGCVGVYQALMDAYIEQAVIGYLSRPDVFEELSAPPDDDAEVAAAAAEIERLTASIEEWRRLGESGESDPTTVTRSINGLRKRITEQEDKIRNAATPAILRGRIGPDAEAGWENSDLEIKRQILRTVAEIRVRRAGATRGGPQDRGSVPLEDRIEWRWLIGPDRERGAES